MNLAILLITCCPEGLACLPRGSCCELAQTCLACAQAEAAGDLQQRYRFLYASAPDLRVDDVPTLLRQYKELILKYEALACAVDSHRAKQQHGQRQAGQAEPVHSHVGQLQTGHLQMPSGMSQAAAREPVVA